MVKVNPIKVSKFNPTPGALDFWNEFKRPNPYRWPILAVSVLLTGTFFYPIVTEMVFGPPARPEVTYITSFPADREEAEIIRSNLANQQHQDKLDALREENEEAKRELYRTLGRASGMDVDAIEAEAAEERAREEAEQAARVTEALETAVATGEQ